MEKQFLPAIFFFIYVSLLFSYSDASAQITFNKKLQLDAPFKNFGQSITGIAQDPRGFIWITSRQGLHRYDGFAEKTYRHNPLDSNTLGFNTAECIYIDEQNIIWVGSRGGGLDRYDPFLNLFTHFRHNAADPGSLSNDTVTSILKDSKGVLWIGTRHGLNTYDHHKFRFTSFFTDPENPASISHNGILTLYEDRENILWIGCGNDINIDLGGQGGLNKYNRAKNNFTRYVHNPSITTSIANSAVSALYEDSRGHFWVGTAGSGVLWMTKSTGSFQHLPTDSMHAGKENQPGHRRLHNIKFISEDVEEGIWIGSTNGGINRIDPGTFKPVHFGTTFIDDVNIKRDTTEGFLHYYPWRMLSSKDGLLWIVTADGGMYNVNFSTIQPTFYDMPGTSVVSFLLEPDQKTLWIGTNKGLVKKDLRTGQSKTYSLEDPKDLHSGVNIVNTIKSDKHGKLWLGTNDGLVLMDPATENKTIFRNSAKDPSSISGNGIYSLMFDGIDRAWVGTDHGLDQLDLNKKTFAHYRKSKGDDKSRNYVVYDLAKDKNNDLWQGTSSGLEKLSRQTGEVSKYLPNVSIWCVFIDSDERIWTTSSSGLFLYDAKHDRFNEFLNPKTKERFYDIIDIIEDHKKFMWVRAPNEILRIDPNKNEVRSLSVKNGIRECNPIYDRFNIIDEKGNLYIVADGGFHRFHPNSFLETSTILPLVFTGLKINNSEISPDKKGEILKVPLSQVSGIDLKYDQNDFSLEFSAFDYTEKEQLTYQVKLQPYDKDWRQLGAYNKADYYNVPPGSYTLHARGINSEGFIAEKTLRVHISPPWWGTWWAYMIYTASFISLLIFFVRWRTNGVRRRNNALEHMVMLRTRQLKTEKEKVELTLDELKATQEQLILKEKMASLGEMTTGIAHEIQNPLNFVNNFSEINKELIEELKDGINTGGIASVQELLADLGSNTERIYFHGRRADQIVKSMLQLSRGANGQKKLTDIVALADEFMWRAYDAFKNKNSSFDARVMMDFKTELGHYSVVPSDIGKVLMNLYDNAFYAVHEKKNRLAKQSSTKAYEPVVTVTANEENGNLNITIRDNGCGIDEKLKDKIFQPFFTTKPTGQGTGLGLSLCYDIVKAHGGEIRVESQEGTGSEFSVIIPVSNN